MDKHETHVRVTEGEVGWDVFKGDRDGHRDKCERRQKKT